jgi:hypothetical protein
MIVHYHQLLVDSNDKHIQSKERRSYASRACAGSSNLRQLKKELPVEATSTYSHLKGFCEEFKQ